MEQLAYIESDYNQNELMVIDWINSLDIPSCTLTDDINDLKSGCVISDVLSWLFGISINGIQRDIKSRSDAIANWEILISQLAPIVPNDLLGNPEDFIDNNQKLVFLVEYFTTIKKQPVKRNTSCLTKSTESPIPVLSPSSNLGPIYKIDSPQKLPDQVRYEPKPIPETFKEAIIDWFEKLNIIKKDSNSLQLITDVSRTGVLICDLINRIEGKIEIIKGIERNPKNRTQALANINKALEYLRNIPKMNSRYLWSNKEIVDGDEDTIWGLLEDVKSVYYVPIKPKNIQSNTLHTKNISLSSTPLTPLMPLVPPEKTKSPKALKQKNKSMRSYSNKMQSFFSKTSTTTPQITRPSSSRSVKIDSYRADALSVTKVMKKNVDDWVKALGIEYEPQKSGYLNVITNGLLVCELIKMLENEGIRVNSNPKTIQAVQENFEKVFQVLRSKRPEIPSYIISNPENMNNEKAVYSLLYYIMLSYPSAAPVEYKPCYLPYGAVGIRKLEAIIAQWIETLNLVQPPPQCFGELVPELKKGALLCLIASKVTGVKILNIVADPKTDQSSLNNIRKSLEVLRKLPRMSQKFTWSDKDISKGNYSVLLGLLEDLLRWTDGLSCRKNGLEYHKDGPYLRNTILSPIVDN